MGGKAFLDETVIEVAGGRGGNGSASFRRTKRNPRGGPDGGNGGGGGDVYAEADLGVNSLHDFVSSRRHRAGAGGRGGSNGRHGADGEDLVLAMPVGTDVRDDVTGALHASLLEEGRRVLLVRGGLGGRGNLTFKSSTNRAPTEFTPGEDGDCQTFRLTLRLLADVGLVGLPNAGKSTFLNAVAGTEVETGAYPFTTLKPQLGVVELEDFSQLTFADLPGIIGGAAAGAGLGTRFLRHASRTTALLHFVDASGGDPEEIAGQRDRLLAELDESGQEGMLDKPRVLVLSKADLLPRGSVGGLVERVSASAGGDRCHALGTTAGIGVQELVGIAAGLVREREGAGVS